MSVAKPASKSSRDGDPVARKRAARPAVQGPQAVARPFSVRGFTSMLLVLGLLIMLASGLILYLAPRGRVANWSSWTALSLSRPQWVALHINASLLFLAVTVSHLAMNWSRLAGYVKQRTRPGVHMKRELAAAVALAGAIFAGTVLELPPISMPVELKYRLRDSWESLESRQTPRVEQRAATSVDSGTHAGLRSG